MEKFFIAAKEVTVNSRVDKDDRRKTGKGGDNRYENYKPSFLNMYITDALYNDKTTQKGVSS